MNINYELVADLLSRGFVLTNEKTQKFEYACGSIANYKKCSITLGHRCYGELAEEFFYSVRFESFAESGHPEIDHHDIIDRYIAESNLSKFLKDKGILSKEERDKKREMTRMKRG